MSFLGVLRLQQFRCHRSAELDLSAPVTALIGPNGAGKTAVLEALYYLSRLRSFRTPRPRELITHQQDGFGLCAETAGGTLKVTLRGAMRSLWCEEQEQKNIWEFWGRLAVVPFLNEDRQLVTGPSQLRRKFLDGLAAQQDRVILHQLVRYNEVVRQRNAALQQPAPHPAMLEALGQQMHSLIPALSQCRHELVRSLGRLARVVHRQLSGQQEKLSLTLRPSPTSADLAREIATGRTLFGPHLDSIEVLLDGKSANLYGSEGQQRTAAIAVRVAEALLLSKRLGRPPLLLVDDTFGELDPSRRRALLELIGRDFQTVATSTSASWAEGSAAQVITFPRPS